MKIQVSTAVSAERFKIATLGVNTRQPERAGRFTHTVTVRQGHSYGVAYSTRGFVRSTTEDWGRTGLRVSSSGGVNVVEGGQWGSTPEVARSRKISATLKPSQQRHR